MSNENKIRILYVQPGKYPEERLAANELHPLQQLVGGYMRAVYPSRCPIWMQNCATAPASRS